MSSKYGYIKSLIEFVNKNYKFAGKYKLNFNELSVNNDSLCVTIDPNFKAIERRDTTGLYISGVFQLSFVLRVIRSANGIADLDYISKLNNLTDFVIDNCDNISTDCFSVWKIVYASNSNLDSVYEGGIKDFKATLEFSYERDG